MADKDLVKMKKIAVLVALLIITGFLTWDFLTLSSGSCYSRLFSIGSSFCHQLPTHSYHNGQLQFPICARCAGLYIGAFTGLLYGFLSGRNARVPSRKYLIFLVFLFFVWAGDGLNSLISDILGRPFLYQTSNLTRLATGLGMGLVMSTALVTLFNATIWQDTKDQAVLYNMVQVIGYALISTAAAVFLLFNTAFLFQAAAGIAIFTAITIITLLYTIFWVIIWKRENKFKLWRELIIFLLGGFCTAVGQILLLTSVRDRVLF